MKMTARKRINIIGVGVHAMPFTTAIELLELWIAERRPRVVLFPGSDILASCRWDLRQRAIFNSADLTATDGMMLVRICRWFGASATERVYGPDVMLELCRRSEFTGYRHFFYGGSPEVIEKLQARFQEICVGAYSPPFRELSSAELTAIRAKIETSGADIVWVGLGTPKQEFWISENRDHISAPLMLGVGAAFDFLAGAKPQAPEWIRSAGGEWLFRLYMEPRRLWRRYLIQVLCFLGFLLLQITGLQKFSIDDS
jgi:N-acetylglucosaminyldiphosphoundecaprenol N-acetyl-beta-D-mannosaminyltransferase